MATVSVDADAGRAVRARPAEAGASAQVHSELQYLFFLMLLLANHMSVSCG